MIKTLAMLAISSAGEHPGRGRHRNFVFEALRRSTRRYGTAHVEQPRSANQLTVVGARRRRTDSIHKGVIMTGPGIERRRFLRGLGLGAAAIAAGPVLAACGGGS